MYKYAMIAAALLGIVAGSTVTEAKEPMCRIGNTWMKCSETPRGVRINYIPGCTNVPPKTRVYHGTRSFTCSGKQDHLEIPPGR